MKFTKKEVLKMCEPAVACTEDSLQMACTKFLNEMSKYKNFYWLHVPNESRVAIKSMAWHKKRKALGLKSGFPDIAIFAKGRKVLLIELKVKKTKKEKDPMLLLSPMQKITIEFLTTLGFTSKILVASDLQDGLEKLETMLETFLCSAQS